MPGALRRWPGVMLLDWDNPPRLAVRRKPVRDIMLLAAAKARRVKRKPGKAHSTNKERSALMRAKAKAQAQKIEANNRAHAAYKEAARLYWAGISDTHP